MHYQAIIYSINTITTGSLYLLMPISITTCVLTCTSSIYICTSWSIINHSDFNLFPEYFREFPQYIQRKELKWIKIPVTKEVLRGKCSFINFERLLFLMKYFIGWPLKSQMQYSERRLVQCTCMTQEFFCHVRENIVGTMEQLQCWNNALTVRTVVDSRFYIKGQYDECLIKDSWNIITCHFL